MLFGVDAVGLGQIVGVGLVDLLNHLSGFFLKQLFLIILFGLRLFLGLFDPHPGGAEYSHHDDDTRQKRLAA